MKLGCRQGAGNVVVYRTVGHIYGEARTRESPEIANNAPPYQPRDQNELHSQTTNVSVRPAIVRYLVSG
jgi:hypothetical protein